MALRCAIFISQARRLSRVLEPGIGAQRGDTGLLEAVVGIRGPDRRDQEPVHGGAVSIEQRLERRQAHTMYLTRSGGPL